MSFQNFAFKAQAFKIKAFSKYVFTKATDALFPATNLIFGSKPITNTGLGLKSGDIEASFINSNCLTFDGTNDYVQFDNLGYANPTTANTIHMEGGFKKTVAYNSTTMIMSKGAGICEVHTTTTGGLRFIVNTNCFWDTANSIFLSGIEYNFVFDYNATTNIATLLINGVPVTVTRAGADPANTVCLVTNTTFTIGSRGAGLYWNGSLWGIKLSLDGVLKVDADLSCGNGNLVCNKAQNTVGVITNADIATIWVPTQNSLHNNISRGFSSAVNGNKVDGHIKIDAYKNRGTSNFWYRTQFVANSVYATAIESFAGNMTSSSIDVRYGFIIVSTNKITCIFSCGGANANIQMTGVVEVGKYYDVFANVDRAGLVSFYVNNVLQGTADISAAVATSMTCTWDFFIHACANTTGGVATYFSNQMIYKTSLGTGLLPVDGTHNLIIPDVYDFVALPNESGYIEKITNTKYLATAGTLRQVRVPTQSINPTKDFLGYDLQYPAGAWHNGAETALDFTRKPQVEGNSLYIKNTLIGTVINKPSAQAYGTWEIDLDIRERGTFKYDFIQTTVSGLGNGYGIQIGTNMGIALYRNTAGVPSFLITSSLTTFYFTPYERYTIKVTRNSIIDEFITGAIGTFAVYLKGGKFGSSFVLMDASNTGTNPLTDNTYTTSAYIVLPTPFVGDIIGNLKLNGVQQYMDSFVSNATISKLGDIYKTYNYDVMNIPSTVRFLAGSSSLSRASTQAYGEWRFKTILQGGGTTVFAITAATASPAINGYALFFQASNAVLLRRYVGSAPTTIITSAVAVGTTGKATHIRVRRNQTLNQYFVGAADAFELSFQAEGDVNYPIDGSAWNVIASVVVDSTFTTSVWSSIYPSGVYFDIVYNEVDMNLSKWSQPSNSWFNDLSAFRFGYKVNNPFFKRDTYRDALIYRHDRFLIYATKQIGGALTKILSYIKDKFL